MYWHEMRDRILSYLHNTAVYPGSEYTSDGAPTVFEILNNCVEQQSPEYLLDLMTFTNMLYDLVYDGILIDENNHIHIFVENEEVSNNQTQFNQ